MAISAAQVMELRASTGAGMMDCKKALLETDGDLEKAGEYLRKKGIATAAKKASRQTNEGGIAVALDAGRKTAAMAHLACETDFVARNEQFRALLQSLADHVLAHGAENVGGQQTDSGETVDERITQGIATMGENLQLVDAVQLSVEGEGLIGAYVHSNGRIGVLVALGSDGPADAAALGEVAKDLAMHVAASQVSAIAPEDIDPALLAKEKEIYTAQALESGKPEAIAAKMVEGRLSKFMKENSLLHQPFVKDPDLTVEKLLAEKGKALGVKLKVQRFFKYQF